MDDFFVIIDTKKILILKLCRCLTLNGFQNYLADQDITFNKYLKWSPFLNSLRVAH